jgi:hypothetical protein
LDTRRTPSQRLFNRKILQTVALTGTTILCLTVGVLPGACATEPPGDDQAAISAVPTARAAGLGVGRMAIGLNSGTLGVGPNVAFATTQRSNVRVGFNWLSFSHDFARSGVTYQGKLHLHSVNALFDYYLTRRFHLSPGVLLDNGNRLDGTALIRPGQILDLGNASYRTSATSPVTAVGSMKINRVSPMLLVGFGNLVPRKEAGHFSLSFEAGIAYQGTPKVGLDFAGSVCDLSGRNCRDFATSPDVQRNLVIERKQIQDAATPFKFYPVLSLGFGYKF